MAETTKFDDDKLPLKVTPEPGVIVVAPLFSLIYSKSLTLPDCAPYGLFIAAIIAAALGVTSVGVLPPVRRRTSLTMLAAVYVALLALLTV